MIDFFLKILSWNQTSQNAAEETHVDLEQFTQSNVFSSPFLKLEHSGFVGNRCQM